jgi:hypothetical protein
VTRINWWLPVQSFLDVRDPYAFDHPNERDLQKMTEFLGRSRNGKTFTYAPLLVCLHDNLIYNPSAIIENAIRLERLILKEGETVEMAKRRVACSIARYFKRRLHIPFDGIVTYELMRHLPGYFGWKIKKTIGIHPRKSQTYLLWLDRWIFLARALWQHTIAIFHWKSHESLSDYHVRTKRPTL